MTNKKEIIVHGVDVSECEKLAPYNGYDEETKCNPSCCQNSPNCKYKQLKRKERECEELKEKLIRISGEYKDTLSIVEDMAIFLGLERIDHFNIYQCYYKLKEMLNEYRQELKPFKDDYFKNLDTKTIAELAKKSMRLTTENRKLEDALDEAKQQLFNKTFEFNGVEAVLRNKENECKNLNNKIQNLEDNYNFVLKKRNKYRFALEEIFVIIKRMEKRAILTPPDCSKQNLEYVKKQCDLGYIEIQDVLLKAEGSGENGNT